jgi:uncharacterized protein (DUF1501 family)
MKRRDFLRNMAIMPILGRNCIVGSSILANMKSAFSANGKTLIVIFQRGGCDGLNVVVPYGEDEYYNLRPDIAIAPPNSSSDSALDLDGFFGFHPAMSGLYDIFQQGNLAILPTVHYSNANRSHFNSQDYIESGTPNQRLNDGWLNRYLPTLQQENALRAISFSTLAHALQGTNPVATINNLSSHNDQFSNSQQSILRNIFNQQVNNENQARSLLHKHGNLALKNISNLTGFSASNYTVEHGAVYPDTLYGKQLKDIAQLIKAGVGLNVATVSNNGWDHHTDQGGAQGDQATKLINFSAGIKAFYTDLGPTYMSDVTILTISEFGRTAKQNASKGTDHGNASSWFIIGEQVNGGIFGEWPGLLSDQLYQERYLAHTIEFTNVYAEILSRHLGSINTLSSVLPGSSYQPIGFLT